MSVSVIIVSYNSAEHLPASLEALRGTGAEIIVVDNASTDGSAEVACRHGARVIANSGNCGFAAAANQGARAAKGEYLLFLNPDAVLLEGFEALLAVLDQQPEAAAAAGLLVDQAGQPQIGFSVRRLPTFASLSLEVLGINRVWPSNSINRRYRCRDLPLDRPTQVEQPAGACLLVRKKVLEVLGGWDESFYPVWFEDVDLCNRMRGAGCLIVFTPAARFRHTGGASIARISFEDKQLFWYRSLVRYVRKHMGSPAALVMRFLILTGATARLILGTVSGQRFTSAYLAVVKVALSSKNSTDTPPPSRV